MRKFILFFIFLASLYADNPNEHLIDAVLANNLNEAKKAVALGADVNYKTPGDEYFPLGLAARFGYMRMVLFLLNMGADVNLCKTGGWNALMAAADEGHLKIVQLLVTKGANVNSQTKMGRTVLMRAAYHGRDEVVRYLISKGAEVNAQDKEGTTALMLAAQQGQVETIRVLLQNKADPNIVNHKGKTAVDYAKEYKSQREALGFTDGDLVLAVFQEEKKVDKKQAAHKKHKKSRK